MALTLTYLRSITVCSKKRPLYSELLCLNNVFRLQFRGHFPKIFCGFFSRVEYQALSILVFFSSSSVVRKAEPTPNSFQNSYNPVSNCSGKVLYPFWNFHSKMRPCKVTHLLGGSPPDRLSSTVMANCSRFVINDYAKDGGPGVV